MPRLRRANGPCRESWARNPALVSCDYVNDPAVRIVDVILVSHLVTAQPARSTPVRQRVGLQLPLADLACHVAAVEGA